MSPAFRLVWGGGIQRNRLIGSSRWPYFVSSDLRVTECVTSISYLSRAPEESISFIRSTPAIHHLSFPFVLLFFSISRYPSIGSSLFSSFLWRGRKKSSQVRSCERWAIDKSGGPSRLVKSRHQSSLNFVSLHRNDDGMSSRMK